MSRYFISVLIEVGYEDFRFGFVGCWGNFGVVY